MDLTYSNYNKILIEVKKNKSIVLKHDIECVSYNTYELAKLEDLHGIKAIYFYQYDVFMKSLEEVKKIRKLGHLIGYHYDVLDNNTGDIELAINEFSANLSSFKNNGFDVRWICPHGNPTLERNGWYSNKDFIRSDLVRSRFPFLKDIVVDKEMYFKNYKYISDAGYKFKLISSVSDNDKVASVDEELDILDYLRKNSSKGIIISTHSHRWCSNIISFKCKKYFFVFLKFIYLKTRSLNLFQAYYNIAFKCTRKF